MFRLGLVSCRDGKVMCGAALAAWSMVKYRFSNVRVESGQVMQRWRYVTCGEGRVTPCNALVKSSHVVFGRGKVKCGRVAVWCGGAR